MRYAIEPVAACGGHSQAIDMLRRLLDGEVKVDHDSQGAPFLPQHPSLHVSISHCPRAVAVAVSEEGRVGIDVESRRKVNHSLTERVCTAAERESIGSAPDPTMEFLRLWTCKEAVLKCLGTGIKGFGSLREALATPDIEVCNIDCPVPDTVAAIATMDE